jgi:signal transduction histidine kinase
MLEGSVQPSGTTTFDAYPMRTTFTTDRATGTISIRSRPETWSERISMIGWRSTAIVHDIRNPLGTVFAGAEMLLDLDPASPHFKRLTANIYRAAGRMRELLADLADVSYRRDRKPEICKIRDIVASALEAVLPAAENQSVQILNDMPGGVKMSLERSRMERVFFNLIANAVEAMPCGGKIRISASRTKSCMLIAVEDTGPGIPVGIRDHLFEPFVTAGKSQGLGLGLALSRKTVIDHGATYGRNLR